MTDTNPVKPAAKALPPRKNPNAEYSKAERENRNVTLKTPHGTTVRVARRRADDLLKRPKQEMSGNKWRGYELVDDEADIKNGRGVEEVD